MYRSYCSSLPSCNGYLVVLHGITGEGESWTRMKTYFTQMRPSKVKLIIPLPLPTFTGYICTGENEQKRPAQHQCDKNPAMHVYQLLHPTQNFRPNKTGVESAKLAKVDCDGWSSKIRQRLTVMKLHCVPPGSAHAEFIGTQPTFSSGIVMHDFGIQVVASYIVTTNNN